MFGLPPSKLVKNFQQARRMNRHGFYRHLRANRRLAIGNGILGFENRHQSRRVTAIRLACVPHVSPILRYRIMVQVNYLNNIVELAHHAVTRVTT
jgi:hypothetical protein